MSARQSAKKVRAKLFTAAGEGHGEVDLPQEIFGQEPNAAVMHQAHLRQLANARQGTASTKTRGDVSGGGAKPYRQKGTGRARHGSEREPQMPGGGTVFGPHPRSYRQDMPRKMRRLALRSALSVKASEGKVSVLEAFDFEEPKTKRMVELLRALGAEDSALVVLASSSTTVARSVANLPWAKSILVNHLNLHDIFTYDRLVIAKDALELLQETFAANSQAPSELPEGGPAGAPEDTPPLDGGAKRSRGEGKGEVRRPSKRGASASAAKKPAASRSTAKAAAKPKAAAKAKPATTAGKAKPGARARTPKKDSK